MEKCIRVFIVDDHEMVRVGLRRMLELEQDIKVVGEAGSAEEALRLLEALSPHVILMDIKMPNVNGLDATRRLKSLGLPGEVIVLSLYEEYLDQAIEAGAAGYLVKDVKRYELVNAIRTVWEGRSPVHLTLDRHRLSEMVAGGGSQRLSEREQAILRLVAAGAGVQAIAQKLTISESTIKRNLRTALDKIGARNRSEAVAEAVRRSFI